MSVERVAYQARGLRTGQLGTVAFTRTRGPLLFRRGGGEYERTAIDLASQPTQGTIARLGDQPCVGLERVLAALAGLSVHSSVEIAVEGPELPTLDGGGLEFALALRALGAPRDRPRLRVIQAGEVLVGRSRYSFEPRPTVELTVETESAGNSPQRAQWDGTPATFLSHVAARPLQIGSIEGVRVLAGESVPPPAGEPSSPNSTRASDHEEARAALLHLMADLFRLGGPPLGRVFARRPEHAASRQALEEGLAFGLLERLPPI